MVYTNYAPLCYTQVSSKKQIFIPRYYYNTNLKKRLTAKEIYKISSCNAHRSEQYERDNISLIDNTPEEIMKVSLEMHMRTNNIWEDTEKDMNLQKKFWGSFPVEMMSNNIKLFGEIRGRIGSDFLRENLWWLE